MQEPPPSWSHCLYLVLSESHRWLLKYYDSRMLALFAFKNLEFERKFKVPTQITYYNFSFDSTQVLIGCADAKLKIFTLKGEKWEKYMF